VLLVETTRDPALREPNYAYRTNLWNPVNGDELRIIDDMVLPQERSWSLIDSTPEYIAELGAEVFHIYIPYFVYYGYPHTRNGELYVGNGSYFNIRAFTLPYGDYRGVFRDNPFTLEITQEPLPGPPEANYMRDTEDSFERITRATGGSLFRSIGPADIVETIDAILSQEAGVDIDIVICLDTTASMKNDIDAMRLKLIEYTKATAMRFRSMRVGMVLFRDYGESYVTRVVPFTSDMNAFQRTLNAARAVGGRDIPEAVHEALYEAANAFPWREEAERRVILIGDAPPHPEPRGAVQEAMVIEAAQNLDIRINAIILPQ
jgi:hypothetical protein